MPSPSLPPRPSAGALRRTGASMSVSIRLERGLRTLGAGAPGVRDTLSPQAPILEAAASAMRLFFRGRANVTGFTRRTSPRRSLPSLKRKRHWGRCTMLRPAGAGVRWPGGRRLLDMHQASPAGWPRLAMRRTSIFMRASTGPRSRQICFGAMSAGRLALILRRVAQDLGGLVAPTREGFGMKLERQVGSHHRRRVRDRAGDRHSVRFRRRARGRRGPRRRGRAGDGAADRRARADLQRPMPCDVGDPAFVDSAAG